jgi:hypothetical protein
MELGQVFLQGPDFYGMEEYKMAHSRDWKGFPAYGEKCEKDLWVSGNMSRY